MRALSALDAKLYALRGRKVMVRVVIGGVDITDLNGTDWVESVSFGGTLDSPLTTCDIAIRREEHMLSLSPLNLSSKLNQPSVVIGLNKLVIVQTAIVPEGCGRDFATAMNAWTEVFRGRVDNWEGNSNPMTVQCRDISCDVADLHIEKQRAYAIGKRWEGVLLWQPSTYHEVGDLVVPTAPPKFGDSPSKVYYCTVAGLSGQTEPTNWPDDGTPVTDNSVTWVRSNTSVATWSAAHSFNTGDLCRPTPDNGHVYIAFALNGKPSGLTGGAQPSFPTGTPGDWVNDNELRWLLLPEGTDGGIAVEAIMGGLIKDNALAMGVSVPYVWTPNSPSYWRNPFYVNQQPLLEAMRTLALEIGWDVRLKYNDAAFTGTDWGKWLLCFSVPDRAKEAADFTLTSDEYISVPRLASSVQTIRNVIEINYSNHLFTYSDGIPIRETSVRKDDDSIAKYGRRYMGIACALTNNIGTYAEANAAADACLADLKDPIADAEVEGPYRWNVEFGDVVELVGNWYHFTANQKLAVYGYLHTLSNNGACTTRLTLRGKPSLGVMRWLAAGTGPGQAKGAGKKRPPGAHKDSVIATTTPTGARVKFDPPVFIDGPPVGPPGPGEWAESELHLYETPGTAIGEATLYKRQGRCSTFDVTGLVAKTPLYGRVVLVDGIGQRSEPSAELTVTPRQAMLNELDDALKVGCVASFDSSFTVTRAASGLHQTFLNFDNIDVNDHGGIAGTGWEPNHWICPADGLYFITAAVEIGGAVLGQTYQLVVNGLKSQALRYFVADDSVDPDVMGENIILLSGLQYITAAHSFTPELWVNGVAGNFTVSKYGTYFNIFRVWSR